MNRCCRLLALLGAALLLSACAALTPPEPPRVTVEQLRWAPDEGRPRFALSLRVLNPGPRALPLKGVAYSLEIDGVELVYGVSNRLPEIEAYGEALISLYVTPNLLNGARLLSRLALSPQQALTYRLEAKLDMGGLFPTQWILDEGVLSIDGR